MNEEGINKELDKIVTLKKPVLVKAGPGMGKTYTLAYKLKYLIKERGINPNNISIITFTNEAAINMRKGISNRREKDTFIEQENQPSRICTMHKYSHRIVKENPSKVGLSRGFRVLSSGYLREILMGDCAVIAGHERDDAKDTIECRQKGKCIKKEAPKCEICDEYSNLLGKYNLIDHDDQMMLACDILKQYHDVLSREQQKSKYLLVDEYQDINYSQWELIRLLSKGNEDNLFVVGDPLQSIYSFRGGSPQYINKFSSDYRPNAVVRELTTSHRCPASIFKGAFHMVQRYNGGDLEILNKIEFKVTVDPRMNICRFDHSNKEAEFVTRKSKELGPSYSILILVPRLNMAKPIKNALRKKFVNFTCDFKVEKTDVYILHALLNWLFNKSDNFLFRVFLEKLIVKKVPRENKNDVHKAISECWKEVGKGKTLYVQLKSKKNIPACKKIIESIANLRKLWENKDDNIAFISAVINELGIWTEIPNFTSEMNTIIKELESMETAGGGPNVRILTMKKAKGLEADFVFLVGMENNLIPGKDADDEERKEDSRLLYVSMTRAKRGLYILYSDIRDKKIAKVSTKGKSEFLDAIPKQYSESKCL